MKPSLEDSVLFDQVDDSGLLLTLDPTGDGDDEEECPGLDRRAHDRILPCVANQSGDASIRNAPVDEGLGLVRVFGRDAHSGPHPLHS